MLVVDPAKRVDWEELFKHPILVSAENRIKAQLEDTLKGEDVEFNISRFYLKNNLVVDHPADISKKEELNNFTHEVVRGKQERRYEGEILRRRGEERKEDRVEREEVKDDDAIQEKETNR